MKSNQFPPGKQKKKKKTRRSRILRITKAIRYFIGLKIIKLLFSFPYFFPLSWALSLSRLMVNLGYIFAGEYRRQALINLKLYYQKEKSYFELKKMVKEIGIEATKGAWETIYSVSPRQDEVFRNIKIEGKEYLDQALSQGKGVIAISAHLGNFAVMGGKLITEGYPFYLTLKLPRNPGIGEFFKQKMERYHFAFILADPATVAQKLIIRALRRNQIVCLIVDFDQKVGGVPIRFMGQEIALPAGPAIIARRTGSPVLPIFIIRQSDNSQKIIIEPPVTINGEIAEVDPEKSIILLCQRFAGIIESYIKKYPTQWYWINKKHKSFRLRKKLNRKI